MIAIIYLLKRFRIIELINLIIFNIKLKNMQNIYI
jgi:hypothetical protein